MAKHKGRNMRKAKIKRHNKKMLKNEISEMSHRILEVCPETRGGLNNTIGKYYSNLKGDMKEVFGELVNQMESGEIYE